MTMTDFSFVLDSLEKRLYRMEQLISNPSSVVAPGGTVRFDNVVIGPDGNTVTLDAILSSAPTGLALSSGTFFNVVYIDATWNAPATTTQVIEYEIEISKKVGGVYQLARLVRSAVRNFRIEPVEPLTTYGVRVYPINRTGQRGTPTAYVDITTGKDATIPPAPVGVIISRGATSLVVRYTPLTEAQAPDVANGEGLYDVEVDTVNTFNSGNKRTMRTSASIVAFSDVTSPLSWYARVAAIDASGNAGTWSAIAGPAEAGGVIDNMVVAGLDAAKITFGEMSGDRITANTIDVAKLKADTALISKTLIIGAGGVFKVGNPPTTGMFINDQGISLYAGGARTVFLDAVTGNASFKGTIDATGGTFSGNITASGTITGGVLQSAMSGARFRLTGPPISYNGLEMYSGIAGSTKTGRLICLPWELDAARPMVRLESERIGGGHTVPHIDLVGGGIDGYSRADVVATDVLLRGTTIYFRDMGTANRVVVHGGSVDLYVPLSMQTNIAINDYTIHLRGVSDTNHTLFFAPGINGAVLKGFAAVRLETVNNGQILDVHQTDGTYLSNGWYRMYGDRGVYNQTQVQGWQFWDAGQITSQNPNAKGLNLRMNNQGGGWGGMGIRTEGSGNPGFAWHRPGVFAAELYNGAAELYCKRNDGTWTPFYADHVDMSTQESKTQISHMTAEDGVAKIKKLKPIKYTRKPDDARLNKWLAEVDKTKKKVPKKKLYVLSGVSLNAKDARVVKQASMTPKEVQALPASERIAVSEDSSDARWDGLTDQQLAGLAAQRDQQWMGLTAEELAPVYPEAVQFDLEGKPQAIRYRMLTIPLILAVQQLDARIAALETNSV